MLPPPTSPNSQVITQGHDKEANLWVCLRGKGKRGADPKEYKGPWIALAETLAVLSAPAQHHGNIWWPLSAVFSRSLGMKAGTKGASPGY